jgi:hypothetical protein
MAEDSNQPESTADAASRFLAGLVSTHDDDQMKQGLEELAGLFWVYYQNLQERGFHKSRAFILCRDFHGMWWQAKFQRDFVTDMHGHIHEDGDGT